MIETKETPPPKKKKNQKPKQIRNDAIILANGRWNDRRVQWSVNRFMIAVFGRPRIDRRPTAGIIADPLLFNGNLPFFQRKRYWPRFHIDTSLKVALKSTLKVVFALELWWKCAFKNGKRSNRFHHEKSLKIALKNALKVVFAWELWWKCAFKTESFPPRKIPQDRSLRTPN